MKRLLLLLILSLSVVSSGQEPQRHVGAIEFYGSAGFDPNKIRAALPLHEGDDFSSTPDALSAAIEHVKEAVKQATGRAPTDVAPVCCNAQGDWIIYVGLPGKTNKSRPYNPAPKGTLRLPSNVLSLYQETMDANMLAVQKGTGEDDSKGYALATDETLRAKQLATREYALRNGRLLRRVLATSAGTQQRVVAAHVLGYARQSSEQIAALVRASRDVDETVRNNAVRALAVIAGSNPKAARRIPASDFIEMLNSGSWSDRNKAGFLLDKLSQRRDPGVLGQLHAHALAALLEMARWRESGHAYPSRILLGRIAGIEENRLQRLVGSGQVEEIISATQRK